MVSILLFVIFNQDKNEATWKNPSFPILAKMVIGHKSAVIPICGVVGTVVEMSGSHMFPYD